MFVKWANFKNSSILPNFISTLNRGAPVQVNLYVQSLAFSVMCLPGHVV